MPSTPQSLLPIQSCTPQHYTLTLYPYLPKFQLFSHVRIVFKALKGEIDESEEFGGSRRYFTAKVYLNVGAPVDMQIMHVGSPNVRSWRRVTGTSQDMEDLALIELDVVWEGTDESFVPQGTGSTSIGPNHAPHVISPSLFIDFWIITRIHTEKHRGIYLTEENLLLSHLEPCDSRRVFPCVDNPSAAAHFEMRILVTQNDYETKDIISNTLWRDEHEISVEQLVRVSNRREEAFLPELLWDHQDGTNANQPHPVPLAPFLDQFILFIHQNQASQFTSPHHLIEFHQTPLMSTYLLTFVIGEFHKTEKHITLRSTSNPQDTQPIQLRGFIPKAVKNSKASDCDWALHIAELCIQFYFDKFPTVRYPLPKMDLIGARLAALAMENMGAVIFFHEFLIVNQRTTEERKRRITRLLMHEISHQFFGNIARIQDWKYLWMKEGVTRLLEYQLVDHYFPEWNFFDNFLTDIFMTALQSDEKVDTHAIQVDSVTLDGDSVQKMFDAISYGKTAAVLRMMVSYLGDHVFLDGLNAFMRKFEYRSTVAENLWECLHDASNGSVDVKTILDDWVLRPGHPVLIVDDEPSDATKDSSVTYTIDQYLSVNPVEENNVRGMVLRPCCFMIPLQIKSQHYDGSIHITKVLLTSQRTTITLPSAKHHIFNHDHCGFFRTYYSRPRLWSQLQSAMNPKNGFLNSREILGIFFDASHFVMHPRNHRCHISLQEYFQLLTLVKQYSKLQYVVVHLLDKLRTMCFMFHSQRWSKPMYRFALLFTEEMIAVKRIEVLLKSATKDDQIPQVIQIALDIMIATIEGSDGTLERRFEPYLRQYLANADQCNVVLLKFLVALHVRRDTTASFENLTSILAATQNCTRRSRTAIITALTCTTEVRGQEQLIDLILPSCGQYVFTELSELEEMEPFLSMNFSLCLKLLRQCVRRKLVFNAMALYDVVVLSVIVMALKQCYTTEHFLVQESFQYLSSSLFEYPILSTTIRTEMRKCIQQVEGKQREWEELGEAVSRGELSPT